MIIDEAIEILEEVNRHSSNAFTLVEFDAIQLGIEALKRVKEGRQYGGKLRGGLLPGETEE